MEGSHICEDEYFYAGRLLKKRMVDGITSRRHVRLCCAASRTRVSRSGLHQRAGRLPRLHHLTTPRTTHPSAFTTGSRIRTRLQCGGQLARPHRLTNVVADLSVCSRGRFTREGFQFHLVIINFVAGYFRLKRIMCYPSKVYFIGTYYFCQRAVYLCLGLRYCLCRTIVRCKSYGHVRDV